MTEPQSSAALPEEQPILADLAQLGFRVAHIQDLYSEKLDYRRALPTLVSWIPRVDDRTVKEMLVRAVADPAARGFAGPVLVRAFEAESDGNWSGLPWTIGNAINVVADPTILADMIRIATDRSYGRAREMVVAGLGRVRDGDAIRTLIELLEDPEVAGHAVKGLALLQPPEARAALERFLDDDRGWVRLAARRAIAGIDRQAARRPSTP